MSAQHLELPITGMTCASCANRIERKLNKLDGVSASVNYSDAQLDELRAHGYRDEQIAEVVGLVALQLLTGAFNLVAGIHPVAAGSAA